MNKHDAVEQAYKNGYEQGYKDALNKILDNYNKFNVSTPDLVELIVQQSNIKI